MNTPCAVCWHNCVVGEGLAAVPTSRVNMSVIRYRPICKECQNKGWVYKLDGSIVKIVFDERVHRFVEVEELRC